MSEPRRTVDSFSLSEPDVAITPELDETLALLGSALHDVACEVVGDDIVGLIDELHDLCRTGALADAAGRLAQRPVGDLQEILRVVTALFHLVNQAEKQEIVRINRLRSRHEPERPRPESIDAAIRQLREQGIPYSALCDVLESLDIQPTLTAHPTEARRRSILYKQQQIADILSRLDQCDPIPAERDAALRDIRAQVRLLLETDEVRASNVRVENEVEHGLYFFRETIFTVVPRVVDDIRRAMLRHYGQTPELVRPLAYRSWIGADSDGNPHVTPAVLDETARRQRQEAIRLYMQRLRALRRELSLSERRVDAPNQLRESIEEEARAIALPARVLDVYRYEPYRLKISYMMARLREELGEEVERLQPRARPYSGQDLLSDLELIRDSLIDSGAGALTESGTLSDLLVQARAFGLHLMRLDVRQHSERIGAAIAAMLSAAGVESDYLGCDESARLELLERELRSQRPLLHRDAELPAAARDVVGTMETLRTVLKRDPDAAGTYIVSMTHHVSHLLEVLLLAKEAGLWSWNDGDVSCDIAVVPLFETIDDLLGASHYLRKLFGNDTYRRYLASNRDHQEIMLGYSDSNKDGGFVMANWSLYRAQHEIGAACREAGISFRLFHGRGGTVGRGGGRTHEAIVAMPPVTHNGSIRFTEQGEVISFRYARQPIAHRHLEQVVSATILAAATTTGATEMPVPEGVSAIKAMDAIAQRSMDAYRALVDGIDFWSWYTSITPIAFISKLPIASRPVSRGQASEVDFNGLRAIPWVFAWTQPRYIVPGWFGLGSGIAAFVAEHPETAQAWYRNWAFFRTALESAERELARARPEVATRYAEAYDGDAPEYHNMILAEFERSRNAILTISNQGQLLENADVLQRSIQIRNPHTDIINLVQLDLMARARESASEDIRAAIFQSINGIAAAMQSTG